MMPNTFTHPLPLSSVTITDTFWHREMELVRTEVIPYQWAALNDQVPGAAKSYCMHNFRAAARAQARKQLQTRDTCAEMHGISLFPDGEPDPDRFYGFVFQDTDFSKWIEAVGYSLKNHPDPELEATADAAIDIVCAAQGPDGYLDTCYILGDPAKRFTNLKDHHELYCLGHLIEGAVAYWEATGKRKLLSSACRFADYVCSVFGPEDGKLKGYPGHEIAEMALCRLYEATGERRYLDLACFFINQRGQKPYYFEEEYETRKRNGEKPAWGVNESYHQSHLPVREQTEAVGHAVRAMYLYSGMAACAKLTNDETLLKACDTLFDEVVREKLYITGGVGGTHVGEAFSYPFDLPSDTAYSETCAAIGLAFFARRMLEIRPDSRYADVMELALYNTVLSGMALDGKSFFYVNPLASVPKAIAKDDRLKHVQPIRQKWFGCACCPPNIARIVSSIGSYAFTASENTLCMHLYISGSVQTTLNGQPVILHVESDVPASGRIRLRIETPEKARFTLKMRIPGWTENGRCCCAKGTFTTESGYLVREDEWENGDTIDLDFPMDVRVLESDPRVRETYGQVAVMRGPLVYCAEEKDNGENLHLIHLDPKAAFDIVDTEEFGHPVKILETMAQRETTAFTGLYRAVAEKTCEDTRLRLVPYYCWNNRGEGEMLVWLHRS